MIPGTHQRQINDHRMSTVCIRLAMLMGILPIGACARSVSVAPSPSVDRAITSIPVVPDDVAAVPFQLWHGVKHDWKGAWVLFPAEVDGHRGNFILDTGSGNITLERDSLPPDPRTAHLHGEQRANITVHTERIGTLFTRLDSIDVGPPVPQPSNAEVQVDYDSLGTNKYARLGNIGLNGMEPFEVIVDYVHQRLVWIRLDTAGRRLVDVPAYTPAASIPLIPTGIHVIPMYAPQWWGIEVGRGGEVDTLLVDSGTQTETGLSEAEQQLAADQLRRALVTRSPSGPVHANGITLPGPKARDLNILGYFFLRELGVVGFNLRTRRLILYQ